MTHHRSRVWGRKRTASVVLAVCAVLLTQTASCRATSGPVVREEIGLFDTRVEIRAYGRNARVALDKAFEEMFRLHRMFDAYDPESEISKINRAAGREEVQVGPETLEVVERALFFATLSDGAFDPTVLPLVRLWNIGSANPRVPAREEIQRVLALVDYRKVVIDPDRFTVFLELPGMGLDLGGIAKGYAVDRAASILRQNGVKDFLINAGGNVYVSGTKPGGALWRVGITDPFRDPAGSERYLGIFTGTDVSVVSSGDYQRYFEVEGVRYHHIFNPKTGYPAEGLRGTTVIGRPSADCDALSTALFVLGVERGTELLSRFPGLGAIFVKTDGTLVVSPEIAEKVELTR